jgi:hypothetical protein
MDFIIPNKWLNVFFDKRQLEQANPSRPLYTYQTTIEEYHELKSVVINFDPKTKLGSKHKDWCACFVLYCSEWYRRLYQSDDGWAWQGLWDELGFEKDPGERETIVNLGLEQYWGRPILRYTHSRNFLGSVFSEGGLPFQLISKSDNNFGYLMHRTLKDFYQVELFRISLQDVIRRNVDYLPSAFQQEESIELIAEIVNQLMQLVKIYNLDSIETDKPSSYLDSVAPEWRANFPIPLDNNTGTELLDNWLSNATQASGSIKKHKAMLSCEHYLTLPNLTFRSEVKLPNALQFDFKKSDVNSARIDIDIHEGDKSVAYLGGSYAQFENKCTKVRPKQKGIKLKRTKLDKSLSLVASDAGKFLERKYIENSAIQLGEVPLGFVEKNGAFQLLGQASFSTKNETIYLLLPKNFEVEVIVGKSELENTFQDYRWYKVSGDFRCVSDNSVYRISTNKSVDTSGMISLIGNEVMWGTKPALVYKGVPTFNVNSEAIVSKYDFTSFLNNKEIHSLSNSEKYGRHTFTVKNKDKDILLKRSVGILPDDFDIAFKPGIKTGEGKIIVTSSQNAIYSLEGNGVSVTSSKLTNGIEFLLSVNDFPPINVSLTVLANLLSDPIQIELPYPASGIYAFNQDNEPLAHDVSVEDLIGSRLYLYSSSTSSETFNIELALIPLGTSTPSYSWNVRVDDKPLEINLYSYKDRINELMSLGSLDAVVRLTIKGKVKNVKRFHIRRHSHALDIDHQMNTVALMGESSIKHMLDDSFRPIAMLIAQPERNSIELEPKLVEGLNVGLFGIPHIMEKEGPWLIVPKAESEVTFRAGFYDHSEKEIILDISNIKTAIEQFGPGRRDTISDFIKTIEIDPQNNNWNYVIKLWERYSHLPLTTFILWEALVKNHKAMALLLLKMEMDERFIQRLDHEYTIIWEMISPYVWIEAKQVFIEYLKSVGVTENMYMPLINDLFDKLHQALPNYPQEAIDFIKSEKMPPLPPKEYMKEEIFKKIWIQSLIRENSDATWPNRFEGRLLRWLSNNPEVKDYFDIPNNYQYPVAILPVICASIAAKETRISDLFIFDKETLFNIKLIRDFDHNWFNPVYSYFLNLFLLEQK